MCFSRQGTFLWITPVLARASFQVCTLIKSATSTASLPRSIFQLVRVLIYHESTCMLTHCIFSFYEVLSVLLSSQLFSLTSCKTHTHIVEISENPGWLNLRPAFTSPVRQHDSQQIQDIPKNCKVNRLNNGNIVKVRGKKERGAKRQEDGVGNRWGGGRRKGCGIQ